MSRSNVIRFTILDREGDEVEIEFPAKMEVCARCEGTGKHTNPSIDGNGITGSEWAEWDDEDRETYMNGGYDVRCEACHGANVVPSPDWSRASFGLKRQYLKHLRQQAEWDREDASERWLRMAESGERW